ncbi:hypothetical protein [Arhodomonas sp. AD133]|uniref:hypothetical protein n=1 Tax=Arhodomonas sp. AD133 TaxID=3415009 RepID=UPI003EB81A03
MAIKSWDPRKLQDHDVRGSWFESIVVDAWDEAHEYNAAPTERQRADGREQVPPDYKDNDAATHHPFANLRDQLTHH